MHMGVCAVWGSDEYGYPKRRTGNRVVDRGGVGGGIGVGDESHPATRSIATGSNGGDWSRSIQISDDESPTRSVSIASTS